MKTFSSTTIFLTVAFASSVSANNQCVNDLPSTTSAHPYGRNYEFTRAEFGFVGGPIPSTKCYGEKTNEYANISSADQCASTCSDAAVNGGSSDGLSLLGYNYNCHTNKCDCILGNEWDDISSTVKEESGNWVCYEANSISTPTPPPTPAQCTLPATVGGSANGKSYTFTREQPQYRSTTCNVGSSFVPFQADNIQDCANQCAGRNLPSDGLGSKKMIGFDYSCDSKQCTCLTGNSGTNLQDTVQFTNENMACYFVSGNSGGKEVYAQMDTKKYLRANVVQTWD
jgi:hypothetical protein